MNTGFTAKLESLKKYIPEKKYIFIFLGITALICLIAGVSFYMIITKDLPDISKIDSYRPIQTTKIYSIDDVPFADFAVEKRTLVTFDQIPEYLKKAVVAVEDARFYHHKGLDWQGITRAFWENIRAHKLAQGASTITQQLTRALFLHPKKTLHRKAQEMILAMQIDKRYSKDEILCLYLNQMYFGLGAYGVEAAARTYFNKPVAELSLGECALIAGLPQAPSLYNPYRRPELVEQRRRHVLKRMLDERYLTEEQYSRAVEITPVFRPMETKSNPAPYFTEYIRIMLEDKYGSSLYRDGYQIYTTLDLNQQKAATAALLQGVEELDKRQGWRKVSQKEMLPAEYTNIKAGVPLETGKKYVGEIQEAKADGMRIQLADKSGWIAQQDMIWANVKNPADSFKPGTPVLVKVLQSPVNGAADYKFALDQYPKVQGALLAIDPKTGCIQALVGGYDFNLSKFNRAMQAKRQPGSAFKPFIYAAALQNGFTPASVLLDAPVIYQNVGSAKEWKPTNYQEEFVGYTTLRDALENSRNVITVKLLQSIGVKTAIQLARKMGIESKLSNNLSLALGSSGVTLMEMTSAYAAFANGGVRVPPMIIRCIKDNAGNILEENKPQNGQSVLDERINYLITKLMQGVIEKGTGWRAKSIGRPLAGKTGTTNNCIDAWFVGFSPQLAAGVWTGLDDAKSIGRYETGGRAANPIWTKFMQSALKTLPVKDFPMPAGIVEVSIDAKTGMLASAECERVIREYFLAESVPTEPCNQHQTDNQNFLQNYLPGGTGPADESPAEPANQGDSNLLFD
ncbi:MAG: PBP1A family penicillin-binding protein [Candidatus Schekmanbacteria bacterium]|nr:PBP1A family penicillin-binding protein [Candidatus Schekmanbacteria bacterium]